ncbi:MAG: response regulator [Nitrosopumilus sp.]|nr:response regulator [Nitrosopumilus sp.]
MGKQIKLFVRIFVIDDDEQTTNMLSKFLNGQGFETIVTNDPIVGLEKIRREQFDVILLDVNMPIVTGFGVLEMLAVADILKDQNIFIFSGKHLPEIQLKNLLRKDGVNGFLEKPVDLEKLVNVISN